MSPIDVDDLIRHDGAAWRNGFTPPALDDLLPATPDARAGGSSQARRRLAVLAVAAAVAGAVAIASWPHGDARDSRTPAAGPSVPVSSSASSSLSSSLSSSVSSSVSSLPSGSAGPDTVHHEVSQTSDFTGGLAVRISLTADRVGSLSFGSDDAPVVNYLLDFAHPRAGVNQTVTVSLAPGRYDVVYRPVAERYLAGPAHKVVSVPFPIGAAAAAKGAHPCAPATITVPERGSAQYDLTC